MLVVGLGIIALGWFLGGVFNNSNIATGFFLFSIVQSLVAFWFSDKIAIATSGAVPADEQEHAMLFRVVRKVKDMTGLPMPKVYVIDDPAPNAFATGRNENNAAVAATTGILRLLTEEELEGVIAHEFGHIQNRDILVNTIVVVLVGFLSLLARMVAFGGGSSDDNRGGNAALGIVGMLVAPLVGMLIQLAISRKREFLADATGALTTHHPEHLARALEKISSASRPMINANQATAHLFIANPFGNLGSLFMTHPPVEERVKALLGK